MMVRIEQNVSLAHETSYGILPDSCSAAAYRELLSNNGLGGDRATGSFGGVRHSGKKKHSRACTKAESAQSKPSLTDTGIENAARAKGAPCRQAKIASAQACPACRNALHKI